MRRAGRPSSRRAAGGVAAVPFFVAISFHGDDHCPLPSRGTRRIPSCALVSDAHGAEYYGPLPMLFGGCGRPARGSVPSRRSLSVARGRGGAGAAAAPGDGRSAGGRGGCCALMVLAPQTSTVRLLGFGHRWTCSLTDFLPAGADRGRAWPAFPGPAATAPRRLLRKESASLPRSSCSSCARPRATAGQGAARRGRSWLGRLFSLRLFWAGRGLSADGSCRAGVGGSGAPGAPAGGALVVQIPGWSRRTSTGDGGCPAAPRRWGFGAIAIRPRAVERGPPRGQRRGLGRSAAFRRRPPWRRHLGLLAAGRPVSAAPDQIIWPSVGLVVLEFSWRPWRRSGSLPL